MSAVATAEPELKPGEARINELRRIATAHRGILRAEDVVAEAADPDNPLHGAFTWDDSEAAQEFRLIQARKLIRVTVQYLDVKGENRAVRVFVSLSPDRDEDGGGYRTIETVMGNSALREQLLEDAKMEMTRFTAKYSALEELAEVFAAMKSARKKIR